jgi:uncharacterized membrane protein YcfT
LVFLLIQLLAKRLLANSTTALLGGAAGALAFVICGKATFGEGRAPYWLLTLGRHSMPIYVAHVIFAAGARVALSALGTQNIAIHFAAGAAAGIVGPLVLYSAAKKLRADALLGL